MPDVPSDATRCAVVYNPIKISEGFRDLVGARTAEAGWAELLWLETSASRVIARPGEVQVGIVTALIGAPVFIALVRRRHVSEL